MVHLFYRECEMAKGAVAEVESSGGRVKSAVEQLLNILYRIFPDGHQNLT